MSASAPPASATRRISSSAACGSTATARPSGSQTAPSPSASSAGTKNSGTSGSTSRFAASDESGSAPKNRAVAGSPATTTATPLESAAAPRLPSAANRRASGFASSASPPTARNDSSNPAFHSANGLASSTSTNASESALIRSRRRRSGMAGCAQSTITHARSTEGVNAVSAAYSSSSAASVKNLAHSPRTSRSGAISAPASTPTCRPDTASRCAMPTARNCASVPSSMSATPPPSRMPRAASACAPAGNSSPIRSEIAARTASSRP